MIGAISARYPRLDQARRGAEVVRELISFLIEAVSAETRRRLVARAPGSVDDVRGHEAALVAFSAEAAAADAQIKAFLYQHMYRHTRVMRIMGDAEDIVCELFARYQDRPEDLPAEWAVRGNRGEAEHARHIADFIAGMTDRYALVEHARLFDSTPDLR